MSLGLFVYLFYIFTVIRLQMHSHLAKVLNTCPMIALVNFWSVIVNYGSKSLPIFACIARLPSRRFYLHSFPLTLSKGAHLPSEGILQIKTILCYLKSTWHCKTFYCCCFITFRNCVPIHYFNRSLKMLNI